MKPVHINADLGERGPAHPEDRLLAELIDLGNVACGGHAGEIETAKDLNDCLRASGAQVSCHLSYPDREHFGRRSSAMPWPGAGRLAEDPTGLAAPGAALQVPWGALQRRGCGSALAERCADWLIAAISPASVSAGWLLALAATERGLQVLAEGFADRAYDRTDRVWRFVARSQPGAVHDADGARRRRKSLAAWGLEIDDVWVPWPVDTLCVHSDNTADAPHHSQSEGATVIRLLEGPALAVAALQLGLQHRGHLPGGPRIHFRFSAEMCSAMEDRFAPGWEMTLMGARFQADEPMSVVVIGAAGEQWVDGAPVLPPQCAASATRCHSGDPGRHCRGCGAAVVGQRAIVRLGSAPPGQRCPTGRQTVAGCACCPAPNLNGWSRSTVSAPGGWINGVMAAAFDCWVPICRFQSPTCGQALWSMERLQCASRPLLLLRQRPCLGGYARVLTVIPCDVDIAAQRQTG